MLKSLITCPYCKLEFSALVWVDGNCTSCGANYCWSTEFNEDFSDGWHVVNWDISRSIYVASTLSNWKRARDFIKLFRKAGITIAFDWTKWGEEIDLSPRDIDPISLQRKALAELAGVTSTAYILAIVPAGCGTNFELGVAYHRYKVIGIPVITILDETEPVAPTSFHYLPGIRRMRSATEAIADVAMYFGVDIKDTNIDRS